MSIIDPETGYEEMPQNYTTEVNDLGFIIAQMTSGVKGALPEQEDFEIAENLAIVAREMIDEYYTT